MFLIMVLLISSMLINHVEVPVKGSYNEASVELTYQLEMLEMMFFHTFWC
jgi:hypothetical protein